MSFSQVEEEEYVAGIQSKLDLGKKWCANFSQADKDMKNSIAMTLRRDQEKMQFTEHYATVVDDPVKGTVDVVLNDLVMYSEIRAWELQKVQYQSTGTVMESIADSICSIAEDPNIASFLQAFKGDYEARLKVYCDFLAAYPDYKEMLEYMPQIPMQMKQAYNTLGPGQLRALSYVQADIERQLQWASSSASVEVAVRGAFRISGVVSEMTKDNTYVFGLAEGQAGEKVSWSTGTGAKILAVVDGGSARTYVRNLSTAQLNWRLSDRWSLTGEVRYTPSLPSLADLSPVFQRTDDVEAAHGFAGLKPSQMLDSRLLVRFAARNGFYTNLQTGYRKSFGEIITTYRYDRATDLFVSSPQNSDYYNNLYLTGEVGIKGLFDHVNVSFDGKLMREQTKGDGFHHVNDNLCVNVNAQAYWEKFLIGCNFNLKPEWCMSGEFLSKSEQAQNIYAQYSFRNLKVSLTWHCPFNPQGYSYETVFLSEIHPGRHINWTTDNGNMVTFGLTWNLDFGSAFHKGAKTLHNGGYDAGTVR